MNLIQTKYKITGALESLQGGRLENQDSMGFADTPIGFVMALCDGMGGGPGGRTASSEVVDTVINVLSSCKKDDNVEAAMRKAIEQADKHIEELTARKPELRGMGTTIVLLVINKQSAHVAHVGDSRLYQFRSGHKVFRTADHSLVGELVRKGELTEEEARVSSNSNIITRAINGKGIAHPDITELPYEAGDRFVLCTDGIWGSMPEKELMNRLANAKSASGGIVMQTTIEVDKIGQTNGGTHDNLSLVVIDTETDSKLRVKMGKRAKIIMIVISALLAFSFLVIVWLAFAWHDSTTEKEEKEADISRLEGHIEKLLGDSMSLSDSNQILKNRLENERSSKKEKELLVKKSKKYEHEIDSLRKITEELKKENRELKARASSTPSVVETANKTSNNKNSKKQKNKNQKHK